jgi:hypothetical protein
MSWRNEELSWRRRGRFLWLLLGIFGILWLLLVGDHRHMLEIATPHGALRIVGRESTFQISLPGQAQAQVIPLIGYAESHLQGVSQIHGCRMEGWGITRSTQKVKMPHQLKPVIFLVNGIEFQLDGKNVCAAGQEWTLMPGQTTEIELKRLK